MVTIHCTTVDCRKYQMKESILSQMQGNLNIPSLEVMPLPEVSIRKSRGGKCIVLERHKLPTPFSMHCDSVCRWPLKEKKLALQRYNAVLYFLTKAPDPENASGLFHQVELGLKLVSLKRAVPASTLNRWEPVPMRKCYFPPKQKHTGKQCVKNWLNVFCGFMACSLSFYNTVSITGP